ncbi:MAG: hypothetical protein H7Z72_16755 [Bacteroidetes bacterium]|nr:hypothetical protein [Fibrella sp.]
MESAAFIVLTDLLSKSRALAEEEAELVYQINKTRAERVDIDSAIGSIYRVYPDLRALTEEDIEAKPLALLTDRQLGIESKDTEGERWIKPEGSWLQLIVKAITESDNLLRYSEIAEYLNMPQNARNNYRETLTSSLNQHRGKDIIGYPVYKWNPKQKTSTKLFLNGVPDFFEDVGKLKLKPRYEEKLKFKVKQLGFFLTHEDN